MSAHDIATKLESLFDYLQDILHENVACKCMSTFYYGSQKEGNRLIAALVTKLCSSSVIQYACLILLG